jgi:hypothetical protein
VALRFCANPLQLSANPLKESGDLDGNPGRKEQAEHRNGTGGIPGTFERHHRQQNIQQKHPAPERAKNQGN